MAQMLLCKNAIEDHSWPNINIHKQHSSPLIALSGRRLVYYIHAYAATKVVVGTLWNCAVIITRLGNMNARL